MTRRAQKRAAALAALLSGAAGVASCNLIVGVGDYSIADAAPDVTMENPDVGAGGEDVGSDKTTVHDAPADVRSDGQADADGGAPGPDVVTDTRGDGPAPGTEGGVDGGDGGDARVADAGDGDAPSFDCGQTIPTGAAFTSLVNACAATANCDPYLIPVSVSDCITYDLLNSTGDAGEWSCLAKISNCSGYFGCQGIRYAATECASTVTSSCMGNNAVDCSGTQPGFAARGTFTNCAMTAGACRTYTDSANNSRAGCVVSTGCTVTGIAQCAGNDLYTCVALADGGTVADSRNCGAATCVTTVDDAGASSGACDFGNQCLGVGNLSCNGTTLACANAGVPAPYDCAPAGGTCSPNAGNPVCVSPGCSTSSTCIETCGGSGAGVTITACVGGASYPIDCGQYGFNFCGQTQSPSGQIFAYCTP